MSLMSVIRPSNPRTALWDALRRDGHAVISYLQMGVPEDTAERLHKRFFADEVLEPDVAEVHKDRDRARDVIRYSWNGDELTLAEHDTITIFDRSGYAGPRTPNRIYTLDHRDAERWIAGVLTLLPPEDRQPEGTFGINMFRTRTHVVSGPHQDNEEWVIIAVLANNADGARTGLLPVDDPDSPVLETTLKPGQLLIFRDSAFLHCTTPLEPRGDTAPCRDALVCTVNYPDTYRL
jgi:hypothetical protein